MGDYVLEGSPALERLIERFGAQGRPLPSEESSRSAGYVPRSQRRKRSKARAPHRWEMFRRSPTAADSRRPAETADVEDDSWALHDDAQDADEMFLLDFDEEPELIEDSDGYDEQHNETDDADEIIDVYGLEELNGEEEASLENEGEGEGEPWILDAFKAWMLEAGEDHAVQHEVHLVPLIPGGVDADELMDA